MASYPPRRREFLKTIAAGAAGAAAASLASRLAWAGPAERPNIVVLMSDEHNAGVLGANGNPLIRTPHLDSLAASGVSFDACYTNSPLCVPARLVFTAGKYASRINAWNNNSRLPSNDFPSLPASLNAAGYQSFLCGKMHYCAAHRYGFTEVGGNFNDYPMSGRIERRDPNDLRPSERLSPRLAGAQAGEDSEILSHDRRVTAGALKFLNNRTKDDKPFFLLVGYLAPHFPLIVPEAYRQHYTGQIPAPLIPPGLLESLPLNYQHLRTAFEVLDVPAEKVRNARELYYGLTEWVDNEMGRVLAALQNTPNARNTVVIYTSDHGENLGEHGLWWKNTMYDHAARIPLIISWPARWKGGQRRTAACSLVDVVQTIAGLSGATTPEDWDGASLLPSLDDPAHACRDVAVSEYYGHNVASGYAMLRTGPYKYVYFTPAGAQHPAQRQLFDLHTDPGEFHNLAALPEHAQRVQNLHATLVRELGEDPDLTEQRCRNSKPYAK